MQEGHPVAYESQKLIDTERLYTVQEKEITVVVHSLRVWRQYLLGSRLVVKTDNVAISYFQTQKKLSPKQPLTPNSIAIGYKGSSPAAYKFAEGWQEQNELARSCLNKTVKRMKKWADKKRR